MNKGILQVTNKKSGEIYFEITTTIEELAYATFNFYECEYLFFIGDYPGTYNHKGTLKTEDIKKLMEG